MDTLRVMRKPGTPLRILLADDHVTVRHGLRLLIDSQTGPQLDAEHLAAHVPSIIQFADELGGAAQRTFEVNIPAGVTDGQRIRLAGQGGRGGDGGRPGDLYFIVRILPHPLYRVQGRDLYVELRLAPWEAALGTSVAVDTPGGEAKVKVPHGTSSGRRLRLRGRGLPNPRGKPGDLYAEARIMVPARLSRAERQLFEQLAATSDFDPRSNR